MNGFGGCSAVGVTGLRDVAGPRRGYQNAGCVGWNVVVGRSDLINDVRSSGLVFTCDCRCGGCWSPPTGSVPEVCRPRSVSGSKTAAPTWSLASSVTYGYQGSSSQHVRVPNAHQRQDAIWHYSPPSCPSSCPSWAPRWHPPS